MSVCTRVRVEIKSHLHLSDDCTNVPGHPIPVYSSSVICFTTNVPGNIRDGCTHCNHRRGTNTGTWGPVLGIRLLVVQGEAREMGVPTFPYPCEVGRGVPKYIGDLRSTLGRVFGVAVISIFNPPPRGIFPESDFDLPNNPTGPPGLCSHLLRYAGAGGVLPSPALAQCVQLEGLEGRTAKVPAQRKPQAGLRLIDTKRREHSARSWCDSYSQARAVPQE
eukprot:895666-Rhodomonas_salina.2